MTEQQLKDLLADMSLEEKIGQMVQLTANFYGTDMLITGPMGSAKIEPEDMKLCGTILGTSGAAKLKEIQDNAMATQPHHIPMLFMLDVINGFQTIFPIPLAQGCSFANGRSGARCTLGKSYGVTWGGSVSELLFCKGDDSGLSGRNAGEFKRKGKHFILFEAFCLLRLSRGWS